MPRAASVPRKIVEEFYAAFTTRDVVRLAPLLHEHVEWTISGPVDLLIFCGTRRGKQAVLDLVSRKTPHQFDIHRFEPAAILIDGDRAAALSRLSGITRDQGRAISYRVAQFLKFEANKLVEYCSVIDSFDAVEQVTGQRLVARAACGTRAPNDDLVLL